MKTLKDSYCMLRCRMCGEMSSISKAMQEYICTSCGALNTAPGKASASKYTIYKKNPNYKKMPGIMI